MASSSDDDGVFRPTDNKASVALLRRVRAGDHVHFVHHVDVCVAPPEVLVAYLEPVPGTGLDDDGYGRIWYFYHAKKFTNTQGKLSGYRHRAVTGGGGASWHQEARKNVEGYPGGTYCTLSYGHKKDPSSRSIERLGWCMVEFDFVAADEQQDEAAAASNYVLCKVYRSPRAKGKPAPASASASASSSGKNKKASAKKRKAGGGEHPEAPPAKSIHQQQEPPQVLQETAYCYQQEDVQQQQAAGGPDAWSSEHGHGGVNFGIEDFNVNEYMDILDMLRDEPEQQPTIAVEPEHDGRFIELPCAPVLPAGDTATYVYGDCRSYAPSRLYTAGIGIQQQDAAVGFFNLKDHHSTFPISCVEI